MFNKILSNLATSPSALNQFVHYSKQLQKEERIRKFGLFFILSAMSIQIFAFLLPIEKSLQYSDNNIINGISTKEDILNAWDKQNSDIPAIYGKFGVSRQDIVNLPDEPNAIIESESSNNYWSINRQPLTGYSDANLKREDPTIAIQSEGPIIYLKPLYLWGNDKYAEEYEAFKGRNSSTGKPFWILKDTGGYTQIGKQIKDNLPKKPSLQAQKSVTSDTGELNTGDSFEYIIEYRNQIADSLAEDVIIEYQVDTSLVKLSDSEGLTIDPSGLLTYRAGNLQYSENSHALILSATAIKQTDLSTIACSSALIKSSNSFTAEIQNTSEECTSATVDNVVTDTSLNTPNAPAKLTETSADLPPGQYIQSKIINDSNVANTTLLAGTTIEYSLNTTNTRGSEINKYDIHQYIGDLTDYADIDQDFLAEQGGVLNTETREITWPSQNLEANSTSTKLFRINIKDPIPSTNSPSTASTSYDCKLSNYYGNELTFDVDCPPIKSIETTSTMSPSTAISLSVALTLSAAFFYLRARLFSKESQMIKRSYQSGGKN